MHGPLNTLVLAGAIVCGTSVADAQPTDEHRFAFMVNAGGQTQTVTRTDRAEFELWAETGSFQTTQTIGSDTVFDGGAAIRLWRQVALGLVVSHVQGRSDGAVEALVPDPFFFDFHREAQGAASDLEHRELGVHLQGQFWIPLSSSLRVTLSGGPTLFSAKQDLVSGIETVEVGFPFDAVDIPSHTTQRVSVSNLGYNVGLDVTYFFRNRFGLGMMARYSRGSAAVGLLGKPQPDLQLGGLHAGGGVRVGF